jgi:hypothetical protein
MHTYRLRRQRVLDSIDSLDLPAEPKMAVRELLVSNIAFMDGCLQSGSFTLEGLQSFARSLKGLPRELERPRRMLVRALAQTTLLWPPICLTYSWVHRTAYILKNEDNLSVEELRRGYRRLLARTLRQKEQTGELQSAVLLFL